MHTGSAARRAGVLYLLLAVAGMLQLIYFPGRFIVAGNATETLGNVAAAESLYRAWLVVSVASATLFLLVAQALEALLGEVDRGLARLMVRLVLVSVALDLMNTVLLGVPAILASGADFLGPLSKAQLDALAFAALRLRTLGISVNMAFWGLWLLPLGRLVVRSGFLPPFLGHLLVVNGVAYVLLSAVRLGWPALLGLAEPVLTPFTVVGELVAIVYLVGWGARAPRLASGSAP